MRPDDIHVILFELFVGGHDREAFNLSLSDEQPVEWIRMEHRKFGNAQRVAKLNRHWRDPGRGQKSRNKFTGSFRKGKLPESVFDRNLPCTYRRKDQIVFLRKNLAPGSR